MTLGVESLGSNTLGGFSFDFPDENGICAIISGSPSISASGSTLGKNLMALAINGPAATAKGYGWDDFVYRGFIEYLEGYTSPIYGDDPNEIIATIPQNASVGDLLIFYNAWKDGLGCWISSASSPGWEFSVRSQTGPNIWSQIIYKFATGQDITNGTVTFYPNISRSRTTRWMWHVYRGMELKSSQWTDEIGITDQQVTHPAENLYIGEIYTIFAAIPRVAEWTITVPYNHTPVAALSAFEISIDGAYSPTFTIDELHTPESMSWDGVGTDNASLISVVLKPTDFTYTFRGTLTAPVATMSGSGTCTKHAVGSVTGPGGYIVTGDEMTVTASGGEIDVCQPSANSVTVTASANDVTVTASANDVSVDASIQDVC